MTKVAPVNAPFWRGNKIYAFIKKRKPTNIYHQLSVRWPTDLKLFSRSSHLPFENLLKVHNFFLENEFFAIFHKSISQFEHNWVKKTDSLYFRSAFSGRNRSFLRMYWFLFRTGSNWLLSHTGGSMSPFQYLLIALTQRLGSLELEQDPREMGSQSDINTFQQLKELVLQGNTWWQRLIENKKWPHPSKC